MKHKNKFTRILKEIFKYCHCPMDQKLLENIWDKCKDLNRNKILGKSDYYRLKIKDHPRKIGGP